MKIGKHLHEGVRKNIYAIKRSRCMGIICTLWVKLQSNSNRYINVSTWPETSTERISRQHSSSPHGCPKQRTSCCTSCKSSVLRSLASVPSKIYYLKEKKWYYL
jgi:hypothetical protein